MIRAPARFSVLVMFGLCAWRRSRYARCRGRGGHKDELAAKDTKTTMCFSGDCGRIARIVAPAAESCPGCRRSTPTASASGLRASLVPGAVAILPLGLDIDSTPAMVQSLEHHRPIVNGYSGQRPAFYGPLVEAIDTFPSRDALAALHDSRVRFVVTPAPVAPIAPSHLTARRARQIPERTIYELRWTPELETRLAATTTIEPPAAWRRFRFTSASLREYRVDWGGAGVSLSAGEISIAVEPPAYRLVVNGHDAPWVAKFFEAQDVFATQADAEPDSRRYTSAINRKVRAT